MSGNVLDTNAVIALQKKEETILKLFDSDQETLIPVIVMGELYYGAHNSGRVKENLEFLAEFVTANTILACDAETARWYGRIRHELKTKGRPIPENDVWIAALAMQHDLALITRDTHFGYVTGLKTVTW
jgi:tRNA(fMet)-specific endonuclease VapC